MQPAPQWGGLHSLHQVEARREDLSLRQERLNNALLQMRQQHSIAVRKERREELRAQVQRLEGQVRQYELEAFGFARLSNNSGGVLEPPSCERSDFCLPGSSETLIERFVHQNERIMALLLSRSEESASQRTNKELFGKLPPPNSPDKLTASNQTNNVQTTEEPGIFAGPPESVDDVPMQRFTPNFQAAASLSWLPEFEWTDDDEMALDKLENEDSAIPASDTTDSNSAKDGEGPLNAAGEKANISKEQKARDRLESRKKLETLLSASLKNSNSGALRKPRWRLESEAESDGVLPFEPQDAEAMEPIQVFRSAVLAVMYTVHLQKLLMAKKRAEKESATRDFESMLRVYFDATRMWLGNVVRTPLLSLLQDSSVDVDISTRNGLTASSLRGFAKKFSGVLALRSPSPALPVAISETSVKSTVDPVKLLKLKVRLRGVLQALSKAIDKKEVPSGILDFWKRISTDGVYFPTSYQIFDEERRSLEFNALGATRRMDFEGTDLIAPDESGEAISAPSSGFLRFNVVLINFLLVRILIPHVILQPWNVGIGSKKISKQASANLVSLATLLYCVCKKLSPLPSPPEPAQISFLGRRRSKTLPNPQQNTTSSKIGDLSERSELSVAAMDGIDPALVEQETKEDGSSNSETVFLSIEDIGRQLISDKNFPSEDAEVTTVVNEHKVLLRATLTSLRFQLQCSDAKR